MNTSQIISISLLLAACGLLQSAVGFGFALFAIPTLLWLKLPLPIAIATSMTACWFQMVFTAFHLRQEWKWRSVAPMAAVLVVSMPVGVMLLARLATLDEMTIRQYVGITILMILAIQGFWRIQPREYLHPAWGYVTAAIAGMLSGSVGTGGPPIVLWAMTHDWPGRRMRGTIMAIFMHHAPFTAMMLCWYFGWGILHTMLVALVFVPGVLLGSNLGLWLGNRMSRHRLRQVATGLLVLLSLRLVAAPYL